MYLYLYIFFCSIGNHLKRDSVFQLRSQAQDLLDGKIKPEDLKDEKRKLLEKVAT
jgi:hypothetical protein